MVTIRVTCGGCGIEYTDEHGNARHALKTAEDGPFLCDAKQAERLVRLGVAAYVTTEKPDEKTDSTEGADNQDMRETTDAQAGRLSAEDLEKWDFNDLKKLAADMGVKPEGKKKVDYIAAIAAAEVTAGDEVDENDELPELGAVDPE